MSSSSPRSTSGTSDPYRAFQSRRGRTMALVAAVATVVVFTTVALSVPGAQGGGPGWRAADRVLVVAVALAIAALLWRFATVRAVPSRQGLIVRNILLTRTLAWPQIVRVGFSGGAPWVVLELADTEQLAVMAIQRADGAHGRAEASRLAALVEHHSQARER